MGGRKGFISIPEGCGGWGWHKFSGELREAVDYLSAKVGCGFGSSLASVKEDGKEEEVRPGLAPVWKGPSFVEALRSGSVSAMKKAHIVGGRQSGWRALPSELCALDILPLVRHVEVEPRSTVDCFSLEYLPIALLDFDRQLRPQGKKIISRSNLKFEILKMRTWSKLGIGFNLALGWAVRKFLDRFVGSRLGQKLYGFRMARLILKHKASRPSRSLPESTPELSSGMFWFGILLGVWRLIHW
jgi:hypothetical protein